MDIKIRKKSGLTILIVIIILISTNASSNYNNVKNAATIAENNLLLLEGITGISYKEDPPRVIVMIEDEQYGQVVPAEIEGIKTEIIVTGKIKALIPTQLETIQIPLLLGVRESHWDTLVGGISVGTKLLIGFGTISVCTSTGPYILSCTHILAMTRSGIQLPVGIAVIQPGLGDGGGPVVGHLAKYIRIKFGGIRVNYADAAVADLEYNAQLNVLLGSDNVNTYNITMNSVVPSVGQIVRKSGAISGVTQNQVLDNHVTILVQYGFRKARFKDVIMVNQPFISPGDSGSFVDLNGDFVGLGFAGNTKYGFVCKANYIKSVLGI